MTRTGRHTAVILVTMMGVQLLAQSAIAQQSVIDHCRKTSSDADRIACLEAALLGREVQPARANAPDAPPASAVEGIGADQVIARNQTQQERIENLEEARGMNVAGYDVVPHDRLVVRLENGQVWRQIKGDTQKVRVDLERNQTVDIEESSLGGYKLRLNEIRRTIRVERIE